MLKNKFIVFIFFSVSVCCQELYYPGLDWEQRKPESLGFSNEKIKEAIQFAIDNENSVDRNLKNAIISAFGHEPRFEIKGPTKPRRGPNGLIIKDGFIIGKWGDVSRVDMTFSVTKSYLSTVCLLYTSPSPRDIRRSRMPSSA